MPERPSGPLSGVSGRIGLPEHSGRYHGAAPLRPPPLMMKGFLAVVGTLVVLALLAIAFPFTGLYNVSAAAGHTGLTEWYLHTLTEHSIESHAADVSAPDPLGDSAAVARGAVAYAEMCQTCHGGPGVERGVTGLGLTPTPPDLDEAAHEWAPGEVYWILDEGIKMAGMPAYGRTHDPDELWEIVAFVAALPGMTGAEYAALTAPPEPADTTGTGRPLADDGHDHVH